jgi:hypothetical protein
MTAETTDVWTFLKTVRRRRRRDRRGRIAYALYIVALVVAIYGSSFVARAVRSVDGPPHASTATARLIDSLPAGMSGLWLLVMVALIRQATWRGPVLLSAADAEWMLAAPLSRARLLRPRLRASVLTGSTLAAVVAFMAALVLHGYGVAALGRLWPPLVASAVLVVAVGLSMGALVERFDVAGRVVLTWSPALAVVALLFGVFACARSAGAHLAWLQAVILWSGPWGWCSQLVDQAFDASAAPWPAVAAPTGVIAVAMLIFAGSTTPAIPARALRQRAATAQAVSAAVFLGETRDARLGVREGRGVRVSRRRLPMPLRSWLALPWRDTTSLIRSPAVLAWALLGLGVMGAALRIATGHASQRHALVPLAIAMVAGYAAASQLIEPARLDADDTRRTRWSPYSAAQHARRHAAVPLLVLELVSVVVALVASPWLGERRTVITLVAAVLIVPVLVAAAMVGSYRGRVPLELLLGGADIGFGPTGPLFLMLWYLYGPLAAIVGGQLILARLVQAWHERGGIVSPILGALAASVAVSAVLYAWVGHRARKLGRFRLNAAATSLAICPHSGDNSDRALPAALRT